MLSVAAALLAGMVVTTGSPGAPLTAAHAAVPVAARIATADAYGTAVEVARQIGGGTLTGLTHLIVVTGENFPDALAATGLAGYLDTCDAPSSAGCATTAILLTAPDSLPAVTRDAIADSGVPAADVMVLGGEDAVSSTVHTAIARAAGWSGTGENPAVRVAGADRYQTAAAVAEYVQDRSQLPGEPALGTSYRTVLVATGENFPDALSAGMLAYRNQHVVLLSRSRTAPDATLTAIDELEADCAIIVGGTRVLSSRVVTQVNDALAEGRTSCTERRLAGRNRYGTSTKVADEFVATNGSLDGVVLVSGEQYRHALVAAPLTRDRGPLLLTRSGDLPAEVADWLTQNAASISEVVVVGNDEDVSPQVVNEISAAVTPSTAPPTLGGGGSGGSTPSPASGCLQVVGGSGYDAAEGLSTDTAGSMFLGGLFVGATTVGASSGLSATGQAGYLAKLTSTCEVAWATSIDSSGNDTVTGVAADVTGSAITVGNFQNSVTLGASTLATGAQTAALFVAKADAAGAWQWATQSVMTTGSDNYILPYGVAVLPDGSSIMSGFFNATGVNTRTATATLGATVLTTTKNNPANGSAAYEELFIAKVGPDGSWLWATQSASTATSRVQTFGKPAVDVTGSAIVTGWFAGAVTFGGTTLTTSGVNEWEIFVAKISSSGIWEWARQIPLSGTSNDGRGEGVSMFADGSAIVTGWFLGTATFGTTTLTANGQDIFVAKIGADGTWLWASRAGGPGADQGRDVVARGDGSAVVTGMFNLTATVGATPLVTAGSADVFVARVAADGTWDWAVRAGGPGADVGTQVANAADDSALVVGSWDGTGTFGSQSRISRGSDDVFVARVSASGAWQS